MDDAELAVEGGVLLEQVTQFGQNAVVIGVGDGLEGTKAVGFGFAGNFRRQPEQAVAAGGAGQFARGKVDLPEAEPNLFLREAERFVCGLVTFEEQHQDRL